MNYKEMKIGGRYNLRNQNDKLVYMGTKRYPDGLWCQFAKVDDPEVVWCEVRPNELSSFEETKEATQ